MKITATIATTEKLRSSYDEVMYFSEAGLKKLQQTIIGLPVMDSCDSPQIQIGKITAASLENQCLNIECDLYNAPEGLLDHEIYLVPDVIVDKDESLQGLNNVTLQTVFFTEHPCDKSLTPAAQIQ